MHIKLNIFIPDYKKLEPYIPRGIVHRQTGISEINAEAVVVKLGRWLRVHFTEIGSAMGSCNVLIKFTNFAGNPRTLIGCTFQEGV